MIRIILILIISSVAFSQNVTLDTNTIQIGEQIKLEISCEESTTNLWPDFNINIVDGIEIIRESKIDTNKGVITQQFIITSWDTGIYIIPPISFAEDKKTDEKMITVKSMVLDKDAKLKDIKLPFN